MPRLLRDVGLIFSAILLSSTIVLAADEITITTYYPSPYGVYNQLQTSTLGVGDNNGNGGLDSGDVPNPTTNPGDAWIKGKVRTSGTILVPQSSTPASPVAGQIYYDSTAKAIKIFDGSMWMTISVAEERLTGSIHTSSQCSSAGGTVYNTGGGYGTLCKFTGSNVNCPSGWVQVASWQSYASSPYGGDSCGAYKSTGPTTFSNTVSTQYWGNGGFSCWPNCCDGNCNIGHFCSGIQAQDVISGNNGASNRNAIGCK